MRRTLFCMLYFLCIIGMSMVLAACNSVDNRQEQAERAEGVDEIQKKRYALVVKAEGNPYNEKQAEGFEEVIEKEGGKPVVKYPQKATVEEQITIIKELIEEGVDSIAIAGNDFDALESVLASAMEQGIKVSSLDSNVNASSRATFVNQAGTREIAQTLMDAVYDMAQGEGQWAILSATNQATNQNSWIEAMKELMEEDRYKNLELVEIAFGDDEYEESVRQSEKLLSRYKDLKVICAPTVIGIMAAAEVIVEHGVEKEVKLTGLGMPSDMAKYIGEGKGNPCPYMFLWNPIDVGRLSAYTSMALVEGKITGKSGEQFQAGDMGEYKITSVLSSQGGGTEIIVGPPLRFDVDNIDEWKTIY